MTKSKWVRVKDKRPMHNTDVLVWRIINERPVIGWHYGVDRILSDNKFMSESDLKNEGFTYAYWQPLPDPPEVKE